MIRSIVNSMLDGYQYPEEYNRHMHTLGYHHRTLPTPPLWERVGRAAIWATNTAREELAGRIDPDTR